MSEKEVETLKDQLQRKDMALTDVRLEALSSAHQLESLKETINKMRSEMVCLKQDNDRLHKIMSSKSLNSSVNSLPLFDVPEQRHSVADELISNPINYECADILLVEPSDKHGKKVNITVFLGCHGNSTKYLNPVQESSSPGPECLIGAITISSKTKWEDVDSLVKQIFKEYLLRIDPVSSLGLSTDSILTYHLGEVTQGRDFDQPELLPCGYLIGEVETLKIALRGASNNCVDAFAFETLTPKSIVQRYVSLLNEHRRIILCGPSGTGKTYLAQKLGEYLVSHLGKDPSPGNIATFK